MGCKQVPGDMESLNPVFACYGINSSVLLGLILSSSPFSEISTGAVWRLLKMKNGGIFWPDIYIDGECHKVQEKHFENGF